MQLINLPAELLTSLPNYLYSLDDWYSLVRTSRRFYNTCAHTKAVFPPTFLEHHPHQLLAGSVRQVADWAVESEEKRKLLWDAITKGNDGLLNLSIEVAKWSLADVRSLHQAKRNVIDPVTWELDMKGGPGRHQQLMEMNPTEWEYQNPDNWKLCEDVERTVYNYLIYCELFHHNIDEAYGQLPSNIDALSRPFREHWMIHCMPDNNTWPPPEPPLNFQEVQLLDFRHLYDSSAFIDFPSVQCLLAEKPRELYASFHLTPHDILFVQIMQHQGLDSLRLLLPGGVAAMRRYIARIRQKVDAIPVEDALKSNSLEGWNSMNIDCENRIGWFTTH
ncbi:hypothetical protein MMC28_002415 [Mycoblastus sanguinarius]|nr:hypothetical protein [Mycoblastus sanguinarius]